MKTLVLSFVVWVLIVPVFVALFLIFTFIVTFVRDLYFAATSLALAFTVLTVAWGPLWFGPFSGSSGHPSPRNRQHPNSTLEKKRAHSFEVRS
ncbi:MAG TPA: hypothetical protein VNB49_13905 [Candidatus Dormibacteraeota bacterium]|nr:hypothetical protein [Candidatus Dormibacteraeota bacterium]